MKRLAFWLTNENSHLELTDSPSSFLCGLLLLLPFACGRLRSRGGFGQTLFICGDDVVVKSLVELSDDVSPAATPTQEKRELGCCGL